MTSFLQPISAWIEAVDRELVRSKHVLLHGNTSDLVLYAGTTASSETASCCMTFDKALHRYLVDSGFSLVLHFNAADGLSLVDLSMSPDFDRACRAGSLGAEVERVDNRLGIANDVGGAVETIRQVLRQNQVSCAVVAHFVDQLVGDPHQHQQDDRQLLIGLKQAVQDAGFASGQNALRNSFIGVASQLTAVPAWLFVDNPRIALVPVGRPNARERRHWIGIRFQDFHGVSQLADGLQDELVRELADRTEGMSLFDISLLPRVSHTEKIDPTSPQELVRAARFGKKEDPWRGLDPARLASVDQVLRARVKGQEAAISHVVSTLRQAHVGIGLGSNRAHGGPPKGVFFFVGPTGVGKTELAKALAAFVFGDDDRMKVFDMSEYRQEQASERLVGAPPGYLGFERGGQLTNHVLSEPFSVILFDEIEKAHKSVNDKFLGILEEGRLTDGRGMTAYFDQSMLVFTSNLGSKQLRHRIENSNGEFPSYEELREIYLNEVKKYFDVTLGRPELRGRYGDNIIVFDMARPELVQQICGKFLHGLREDSHRQCGLHIEFDRSVTDHISRLMRKPDNLELGGRCVRELIITEVVKPLNAFVFTTKPAAESTLFLSVPANGGRISIDKRP